MSSGCVFAAPLYVLASTYQLMPLAGSDLCGPLTNYTSNFIRRMASNTYSRVVFEGDFDTVPFYPKLNIMEPRN